MNPLPRMPLATCLVTLPLLAACSTLGGNVGGDFACRAPEGTCAPTTSIDAAAIDAAAISVSGNGALATETTAGGTRGGNLVPAASTSERSLRIVIAARRDAAGRTHEVHVIRVTLPEPAGEHWRQPASTGDLLRAIGQAIAPPPPSHAGERASSHSPLPGQLFLPSPTGPASLGADAPEGGAPGYSPLPDRVPQSLFDAATINMPIANSGDQP